MTRSSRFYIPSLDGVRGLAVVLVLLYHARVPGFMGGFLGVDLFFVLSGFLITSFLAAEYEKNGKINLPFFYLRRALRLLPALILFLTAGLITAAFILPEVFLIQLQNALAIVTFVYNWGLALSLRADPVNAALHCWSLAVEAQFYLVWPLVMYGFLSRKKTETVKILCAVLILASFGWRFILLWQGADIARVYFGTDTRLDGLMMGSLLALLNVRGNPRPALFFSRSFLFISLAGLILLISHDGFYDPVMQIVEPLLSAFFSACVIGYVLKSPDSFLAKFFSLPLLIWLGKLSYSLYLWHYPFFRIMREFFPWWQTLLCGGLAALICAVLSYYLVEKRFLEKKEKFIR